MTGLDERGLWVIGASSSISAGARLFVFFVRAAFLLCGWGRMSGWWLVALMERMYQVSVGIIGGEEVDLVGAVGDSVGVEVAFVGVAAVEEGAFDLNADEVSVVREGQIEGGRVSPGLGDDETEFGGASHETQLRPLAPRLGVADVHPWIFHGIFAVLPGLFGFAQGKLRPGLHNKKRGLCGPR
jgi:hypothetical protein